jgi:hypothetical protein
MVCARRGAVGAWRNLSESEFSEFTNCQNSVYFLILKIPIQTNCVSDGSGYRPMSLS